MRYSLAIFDLDGTILNTLDDLHDACDYICQKHGFSTHSLEEYKFFVGNGISKMIERALPPDVSKETFNEVLSDYIAYYQDHCEVKTAPYAGIKDCLQKLKAAGITTAVNTNKVESAALILCNTYFPGLIDIVCGNKPGLPVKPDPQGVYEILQRASISKEQAQGEAGAAVYIGDSDVDIQTGKNAGIDVIGVEWGFRGKEFLLNHGAEKTVSNTEELLELIIGN